jgi:putative membrane protein
MKCGQWLCFFAGMLSLSLMSCDKETEGVELRTNFTDSAFIRLASDINAQEIAVSQVAADSSTDIPVSTFGSLLVTDHSDAAQKLGNIASKLGLPVSNVIDGEHQDFINTLKTKKGSTLDSLFIFNQIDETEKFIRVFKNQAGNGLQKDLKEYANEMLPVLTIHLQQATALSAKY